MLELRCLAAEDRQPAQHQVRQQDVRYPYELADPCAGPARKNQCRPYSHPRLHRFDRTLNQCSNGVCRTLTDSPECVVGEQT